MKTKEEVLSLVYCDGTEEKQQLHRLSINTEGKLFWFVCSSFMKMCKHDYKDKNKRKRSV